MAALSRWGVWRRGGMDGSICGLDMSEALATVVDPDLDRSLLVQLFAAGEAAFVRALHVKTSEGT